MSFFIKNASYIVYEKALNCGMKCHIFCLNNIFSMSFAKNGQETAIWQVYMDGKTSPHYNRITQGEVSEKT